MYSHILIALDGSERAEAVLPHAEAVAQKFAARLTLLGVTTPTSTMPTEPMLDTTHMITAMDAATGTDARMMDEVNWHEVEQYLNDVAHNLRAKGLHIAYERHEGIPAQVIVDRAQSLAVDLIVMTTHGRSGLGRLVFGSVAERVLRHAPCPVLLVRIGNEDLDQQESL